MSMETVLREVRQLLSSINETVRNSRKLLAVQHDVIEAIHSVSKRLDKLEDKIERLEKSLKK